MEDSNFTGLELKNWFGGDAAYQRARSKALETGWLIHALDEIPRRLVADAGLDLYNRDSDGIQYTHGVLGPVA